MLGGSVDRAPSLLLHGICPPTLLPLSLSPTYHPLTSFFFLFIKFIGVTLVNKIIQVSGAPLTSSLTTLASLEEHGAP